MNHKCWSCHYGPGHKWGNQEPWNHIFFQQIWNDRNNCHKTWTVFILPDMLVGQSNKSFTMGYQWPNQGKPPKKWTLWQLVLWQAFPVNHLLWLQPLLGNWISSLHQFIHHWHWTTSYATQKLYHWDGQWQKHTRHRGFYNHNPKYCTTASRSTPHCHQTANES